MTLWRLPILEPHRSTLEKCVYCPKLSRAACPVSNVEKNESVTPWGKMSMAYFVGRGDAPIDREHGAPAWACSACYGCRERCDHKNEVATVLTDARADLFERGAAPREAEQVASRFEARNARIARALDELGLAAAGPTRTAAIVGCDYVLHAPSVARASIDLLARFTATSPAVVPSCCGLPLLYAGDRRGFERAARRVATALSGARDVFVVDPGCARALQVEYPRAGIAAPKTELFLDLAADFVERNKGAPTLTQIDLGDVRWHDPCQLSRGLGRYEEPRAILAAITGRAPLEFQRSRAHADCSGGGGLLPVTRPATSRAIAAQRIEDHESRGGGAIVTHCGASLRRFEASGARALDLVTCVARAVV